MNSLIPYKEGIISRICNWFKKIFFKRKTDEKINNNITFNNETLRDRVIIPEDKEKNRISILKKKWEDKEIDAEDISDEDVDKIISLYNKETEKIKNETAMIKENISKMLLLFRLDEK